MPKHPLQEIELDSQGVIRFRKNAIVEYLLDNGSIDLGKIVAMVSDDQFDKEDYEQFLQLIGVSLQKYADDTRVSGIGYRRAGRKADKIRKELNGIKHND